MDRLISVNKLNCELNKYTSAPYEYALKCVNEATPIQAIPLNRVKQAREEIAESKIGLDDWNENDSAMLYAYDNCLNILDKLIAESEG